MVALRNPFAVKNGSIILIEDLSANERGLKCGCHCPACNGEFIARMGKIKVHHFAHSKEPCDEVVAYTSGLYRMIHQILADGSPFYVPALALTYDTTKSSIMNEENVGTYIRLLREHQRNRHKVIVSKGRYIEFENVELFRDKKNVIQAIKMEYRGSKMAIKIMPPDTVCKIGSVSPLKDIATLVIDFTNDGDIIQSFDSAGFKEYLLADKADKYWIFNPKVETAYPRILEHARKAHQNFINRQNQKVKRQRLDAEKAEQEKQHYELEAVRYLNESKKIEEILKLGYEQVRDKFVQQDTQIRDEFGNRWIECAQCGEIKMVSEFSSYGGKNQVNLGRCTLCVRKLS